MDVFGFPSPLSLNSSATWEAVDRILEYPPDRETFLAEYPSWTLASPGVVLPTFALYGAACALFATVWRDRRAVRVPRWLLVSHNAFQVLLSLTMVAGLVSSARCAGYSLGGNRIFDESREGRCESAVVGFVRLFTLSKYYDLVDTLFIVLMKKDRQLTFLHCAHHAVVPVALWYGMWLSPSGDSYFPALVNSFVHLVMYSYYLCASLGVRCPWKKVITQVQLTQFATLFLFGLNCLRTGSIATETVLTNAAIQAWMGYAFWQFHQRTYARRGGKGGKAE